MYGQKGGLGYLFCELNTKPTKPRVPESSGILLGSLIAWQQLLLLLLLLLFLPDVLVESLSEMR